MVFDFLPVALSTIQDIRPIHGAGRMRARSLVPLLVLLLNKGTKMAAGLMIVCPGLAVAVPAPRVVAFPLQSLSCGDIRRRLNSPCVVT